VITQNDKNNVSFNVVKLQNTNTRVYFRIDIFITQEVRIKITWIKVFQ